MRTRRKRLGTYALGTADIAKYRKNGAVRLSGVFDRATLEEVRGTIARLTREGDRATLPLAERDTYGRAFTQVANLWRRDPVVQALAHAPRLARAQLHIEVGTPSYHDGKLYVPISSGEPNQRSACTNTLVMKATTPSAIYCLGPV